MAEGFEENLLTLVNALSLVYAELKDGYRALPLPINLPMEMSEDGIDGLHQSLLEAADRVGDLPVDGLAAATLINASMHWITTTVLIQAYRGTGRASHFAMAVWNVDQAASLAELATALLRQG